MNIRVGQAFKFGLVACLGAAAVIAATAAEAAKNNKGLPVGKVIVQNKSGSGQDLYVYVQGTYDGKYYRVTNLDGDIKKLTSTNGKYKAYGINLGKGSKPTFKIPQLPNARIYLSLDKSVKISVDGNAPSTPSGWSKTDKNYKTVFDFLEYTWTPAENPPVPGRPGSAFNANSTQVDMLGIPLLVQMNGIDANSNKITTKAGYAKSGDRSAVFSELKKSPKPWKKLLITSKNGTMYRAISPYNGMKLGVFPSDQLDGYISNVYSTYSAAGRAGQELIANTNAGGVNATFEGEVTDNNLVFTETGAGHGGDTVTFAMPTSQQAYEGFPGTVPDHADSILIAQAGQIETYVQAAFMRTTMLSYSTISDCPGTQAYYVNDPVNMYAKILHEWAYEHKAYAFGYDDVCDQASFFTVFSPKKLVLKIPSFN